jgi:hypothetical protein
MTIAIPIFLGALHVACSYWVSETGRTFYSDRTPACQRPKVFDIGHKYLPDLSENACANALNDALAAMPLVLAYFWDMPDFYWFWIVIIAVRAITNTLTILPKNKTCDDSELTWKHFAVGHCYDKIFSGHFATTLLFAVMLWKTQGVSPWLLGPALAGHAWLILATRGHYTIDVVVSIFVVLAITGLF